MSGMVLRLLPRSKFDFALTLPAVGSFIIPIAQDVDLSGWREATLLVRVHGAVTMPASCKLNVIAKTSAPTDEDPAVFFQATALTLGGSPADITNNLNNALLSLTLPQPNGFGGLVSFFLQYTPVTNTGQVVVTLSIDLSLKD